MKDRIFWMVSTRYIVSACKEGYGGRKHRDKAKTSEEILSRLQGIEKYGNQDLTWQYLSILSASSIIHAHPTSSLQIRSN